MDTNDSKQEKIPDIETDFLLTDADFDRIRTLAYEQFGIHLTPQKRSLVRARLRKLLRKKGLSTFSEYLDSLDQDDSGTQLGEFINEISTNHTFFYREKEHFSFLYDTVLPEIVTQLKVDSTRVMRLWCAAAATGEEPYSIAMTLHDYFGNDFGLWDLKLLATDISQKALATALGGVYPESRLSLVPPGWKREYLSLTPHGEWEVNPAIRKIITFRMLNLMRPSFPFSKQFQIVFCRNVMIYFDTPTREALVKKLYNCIAPGGYLFIGHSETLSRDTSPFTYVRPAVYRKLN